MKPTSIHTIPVSPLTEGYDSQYLSVEKFDFPVQESRRKLVFLVSHANGFHKEIYRPLIQRLANKLRQIDNYADISIVSWDARFQGESSRLNQDQSNMRYRWADNALDTKQVIDTLELKKDALLFGIGHSFGASSMIILESFYPKTFDGLCLVEPVLLNTFYPTNLRMKAPIYRSINRRDEWPSRESCLDFFLKRDFWKAFDKQALENYVNYGTYETEKGTIRLKCTKEHEYHVFMCSNFETVTAFNSLRAFQTTTRCVFGHQSYLKNKEMTDAIVNRNITVEYIEGSHMVPCEYPERIVPQIVQLVESIQMPKSML
ncbi:Alpha/beta hydrolase fold-1 [Sporodiniella umbellata]|nr:Alpha/beta hydrolase fold-1 [Sporodiniella umbellata]